MAITTTPEQTSALQIHLNPLHTIFSGEDGVGFSVNCGCGESFFVGAAEAHIAPYEGMGHREIAYRHHAQHVLERAALLLKPQEDAGPLFSKETSAVPRLDEDGALKAFARDQGLSGDWHEPDECGVNARIIGTHLDNAMGSQAGRRVSEEGHDFTEFNIVLTLKDEGAEPRDAGVINLATLLSLAAGR